MRRPVSLGLVILLAVSVCVAGCGKIKEGTKKKYYSDGQLLSEATYKAFRKHGPYREYHPNGQIKVEATFKEGRLHGTARAYDEQGNMIYKEMYEDGEIVYQNKY
jgi:antitoxin component YwqK of YwqJK toxin-antitoxin module